MITTPKKIDTIIFDFDNTLYQTEKVKASFYAMAELHGYSLEGAKKIYNEARIAAERIVINLSSYLVVLQEHVKADGRTFLNEEVSEIIEHMGKGDGLVPYAREVLKYTKEEGYNMYLLSLGVKEWQEEKVTQSNISQFFEDGKIIYTNKIIGGKVGVMKDIFGDSFTGENTITFNDKPDETREMLEAFPNLIAFLRYEYRDDRYNPLDFDVLEKDFSERVVWSEDLKELMNILKEISQ